VAGAELQQRAGEAAGAGPDLDGGADGKVTGGAGDAARQIQVEQEMLAKRPPGAEPMAGDDLA